MFDPKRYDIRMRDQEGKRKKPSEAETRRHLPEEARRRKRPEERFDAKRPEQPLPRPAKRPAKRAAMRRRAAPRPPTRSSGAAHLSSSKTPWALVSLVSVLASAVTGIAKGCHPERPDAPTLRYELPGSRGRPSPLRTVPARPAPTVDWRAHLPEPRPDRIRGAVLFGGDDAVPDVELVLQTESGRRVQGRTDEYGVFTFDGVSESGGRIAVRTDLQLGTGPPQTVSGSPGTREAEIHLDGIHTLLLKIAAPPGWRAGEDAYVQVGATDGSAHEVGTWPARARTALVTGLEPRGFYDVLVQVPRRRQAALVERVAAGQAIRVELRPCARIFGHVELPTGASPADVEVEVSHGRLRVTAQILEHGWLVDHLPLASWWDVTARRTEQGKVVDDVQAGVHTGEDTAVVLDLR